MSSYASLSTGVDGLCVLFLLDPDNPDISGIADAQQLALDHQVPLAVVSCVPDQQIDRLQKLLPFEAALAAFNIPLIVLIGESKMTLTGIAHHTKPFRIIKPAEGGSTDLAVHPHHWHGRVITVSEIAKLETIC